jgi:hypothetical protein
MLSARADTGVCLEQLEACNQDLDKTQATLKRVMHHHPVRGSPNPSTEDATNSTDTNSTDTNSTDTNPPEGDGEECIPANEGNCQEYCPEPEECTPINEDTCSDYINEDTCNPYINEETCEPYFPEPEECTPIDEDTCSDYINEDTCSPYVNEDSCEQYCPVQTCNEIEIDARIDKYESITVEGTTLTSYGVDGQKKVSINGFKIAEHGKHTFGQVTVEVEDINGQSADLELSIQDCTHAE